MQITLPSAQRGLTLVEMMIGFTLSAILMAGLFQIFDSNKKAFNMQGGIARVQENGRVGIEFLGREIRSAGFMGCATGGFGATFKNNVDASKYSSTVLQTALSLFDGDQAIIGFNDVTAIPSGSVLAGFNLSVGTGAGQLISGTDAVLFQGVSPCVGGKVIGHNNSASQLTVSNVTACDLDPTDIVVVSDCNRADAFSISAVAGNVLSHGNSVNTSASLASAYDNDSYLFKMKSVLFYIATGAGGEPSLFMKALHSAADTTPYQTLELAEGIEDMQLLYGEDLNDDDSADRYVTADNVTDMNAVIALKVALLTRSPDKTTTIQKNVVFAGSTVVATDYRFRVPFESTVTIRNRAR